uniref:VWFA domain-containing protein n=1 Tax=Sparus aurata TaxID=8175 RepID=A0A671VBP8_SPAAU
VSHKQAALFYWLVLNQHFPKIPHLFFYLTPILQTQRVVRDIVFLVDGSNYIGSSFPYVRDFIINVVNQLDVRPDRVQIGLLQFAERPRIEFYLNSYSNRQDVVNKISQLRLTGGSVLNTGAAMNYALSNMFQPSTGSRRRQGVQQVLVLITGGPAQDELKSVADKLALAGVLTFTVSSGQADQALLQSVAFVPDLSSCSKVGTNSFVFGVWICVQKMVSADVSGVF